MIACTVTYTWIRCAGIFVAHAHKLVREEMPGKLNFEPRGSCTDKSPKRWSLSLHLLPTTSTAHPTRSVSYWSSTTTSVCLVHRVSLLSSGNMEPSPRSSYCPAVVPGQAAHQQLHRCLSYYRERMPAILLAVEIEQSILAALSSDRYSEVS